MHILFVSPYYPPHTYGGAEVSTALYIHNLPQKIKKTVMTSQLTETDWQHEGVQVFPVLKVINLGQKKVSDLIKYAFKIFFYPWLNGWLLYQQIKLHKPDIVHFIPSSYTQVGIVFALRVLNVPTVIDIRDFTWVCLTDFSFHSQKPFKFTSRHSCFSHLQSSYTIPSKLLQPFLLLMALYETTLFLISQWIICQCIQSTSRIQLSAVSEFTKQQLVLIGISKEKITVIPNILSNDPMANAQKVDRKKQFVFAGRIEEAKGIWQIIKAFEKSHVKNFVLKIFGDGIDIAAIRAYIQKKKLHSVHIMGKQPQEVIMNSYLESYAILSPTLRPEPLGRYVLDSFLTQTPLIASNMGGPNEYITDHHNGLLVSPYSVNQISEAIVELTSDRKLFSTILNNLKVIPKKLHTSSILNQRLALYQKILHE